MYNFTISIFLLLFCYKQLYNDCFAICISKIIVLYIFLTPICAYFCSVLRFLIRNTFKIAEFYIKKRSVIFQLICTFFGYFAQNNLLLIIKVPICDFWHINTIFTNIIMIFLKFASCKFINLFIFRFWQRKFINCF